MATKFLLSGLLCKFSHHRHLYTNTNFLKTKFLLQERLLHTKFYDKDIGLDHRRKENHYSEIDTDHNIEKSNQHEPFSTDLKESGKVKTKSLQNNSINLRQEDADLFGSTTSYDQEDEGDLEEEEYEKNLQNQRSKQLRPIDYARMIKDNLKANRLADAIDVLENRMLKDDRAKPDTYIYNLLISGCGKSGYTRKAFSLFTKMRQRGLRVTGGTYTSLLNACANAPSPTDCLERIKHTREIMLEKGYEPNVINYNAMIKAYGRAGDIKNAFLIVDEMIERQLEPTAESFNFLLQACASDSEIGFRHCLLTWHKMLQCGLRPDFYSFHIVLRCVRDCGFGDLDTMQQVLENIVEESSLKQIAADKVEEHTQQFLQERSNKTDLITSPDNVVVSKSNLPKEILSAATHLELPNLLLPKPHLGTMVTLQEVARPHERFLLLGGLTGFLALMKENHITPNIEMFTTMLDVIPPTYAAEKQLISFIRRIGLKADIDFFNMLIKKRSMRFDYEGAKEVLSMIKTAKLHPDIVTYGVLALGCRTVEEARELLQQMSNSGVRMNMQILGAMLRQGCAQRALSYINEIMQISLDERIKPNEIFLKHLHTFRRQIARAIDVRHPSIKTKNFKKDYAQFCDKVRIYYEEHGIADLKLEDAIKKIKERPYAQFKKTNNDGLEPSKNEELIKKNKIRKYIKKIKVENLRSDKDDLNNYESLKSKNRFKSIE